jgi:transglutaminase-like putative cysteine protease
MLALETPRSPMNVQAMPIPLGDPGTYVTIQQMRRLIHEGARDPVVYELATQLVRHLRPFDSRAQANAIFNWMRANIRYTPHIRGTQTLHAIRETIRLGVGDCPMYTCVALAIAEAVGMRGHIVTIAGDPDDPDTFSHVYPELEVARDQWVAVDAARRGPRFGRQPGWYARKRVWDANSEDYEDVSGLGAMHAARHMRTRRRLRGLGQASTDPTSESSILQDIAVAGQAAALDITAANQPSYSVSPYSINPATGLPYTTTPVVATSTAFSGNTLLLLLLLGGGLLLMARARE